MFPYQTLFGLVYSFYQSFNLGDHQGKSTLPTFHCAVCGQFLQASLFNSLKLQWGTLTLNANLLQGQTMRGGVLLVDAVCWGGRVYQNNGVIPSHVMDLSKQLIMVEFKK